MSIDGWVDKENVVYTYMEYYSALNWENLVYVTKHMNLEDIMLSERNQAQKEKYYMNQCV